VRRLSTHPCAFGGEEPRPRGAHPLSLHYASLSPLRLSLHYVSLSTTSLSPLRLPLHYVSLSTTPLSPLRHSLHYVSLTLHYASDSTTPLPTTPLSCPRRPSVLHQHVPSSSFLPSHQRQSQGPVCPRLLSPSGLSGAKGPARALSERTSTCSLIQGRQKSCAPTPRGWAQSLDNPCDAGRLRGGAARQHLKRLRRLLDSSPTPRSPLWPRLPSPSGLSIPRASGPRAPGEARSSRAPN
jgi:hypothetical protein